MRRTSRRKIIHLSAWVGLLAVTAACDSSAPVPSVPAAASEPQSAAGDEMAPSEDPTKTAAEVQEPTEGSEIHPPGTKQFPPNRLADETSPYLLLHAHNPVKWYPWGEEALAKAKAENKLIFLSIGYSSCYWCHVMERESFMDEEIAALLNEHFVAVKVDREERPDIDDIYMTALQVYLQAAGVGGSGGWPLSMFLTPDAKPILGGTYFPPRDTQGRTGFLTVLGRVQQRWRENPQSFRDSAELLTNLVVQEMKLRAPLAPPGSAEEIADNVQQALASQYDAQCGGFGYNAADPRRPKFPEPSNLLFLLNRARDASNETARTMAIETLEKMAAGGIRDHLGGGFHRYSTDRFWRIPHFEKMLYDNAQLASVCAEAFALGGDVRFRIVVDEILSFVAREMTHPGGAFYSALDAETEAEEGRFYAWDEAELKQVLAPDEFELFSALYVSQEGPNFEGRYVPLLAQTRQEAAAQLNLMQEEFDNRLSDVKAKLLAARNTRPRPLTDTKILTAWNGLMIRGFADSGRLLENEAYVQAAARAADFVLDNLRRDDGRLWRTYGQEQAKLNAYLDDYAFLVDGLIALHRATGEERWLQAADGLMTKQNELFWDDQSGGFYFTSHDHEELLTRSKDPIDTVLPSGNAVSVGNLVYLATHLDRPTYLASAERTIRAFAGYLEDLPAGMTRMALAASTWQSAQPAEPATDR